VLLDRAYKIAGYEIGKADYVELVNSKAQKKYINLFKNDNGKIFVYRLIVHKNSEIRLFTCDEIEPIIRPDM
jgi:hypothetical protein